MPPVEPVPVRPKRAPQAIQPVRIVWDYPTNTPDIRFEIWSSPTPKGPFHLTAVVDQSPAVLEREGFFLLRASNSVTHLVSDWASAAP